MNYESPSPPLSTVVGENSSIVAEPPAMKSGAERTANVVEMLRAEKMASGGKGTIKPVPRRSQLTRSVLHLTRRGHLYAGLLLLPWVFLYGITGFLFNHPEVWPDRPTFTITRSHTRGTPLANLQTPSAMAAEVIAAINADSKIQYSIVNPDRASFGRGGLGGTLTGPADKSYFVSLGTAGIGTIRELAPQAGGTGGGGGRGGGGRGGMSGGSSTIDPPAPFAVPAGLMLRESPFDKIDSGLQTVLSRMKLSDLRISEIRLNLLSFQMQGGETLWQVSYNPLSGSVSGERVVDGGDTIGMSLRLFLLRLHMAHGYPTDHSPLRYVWAVIVDAMSLIMVFWGISGIVMWWQIKRTRWLGGLCLLLSVGCAAYVGIGMHELITTAGR